MVIDNDLATIVRFHRKKSGLTQAALAKTAGVGKTVVFDIEKGKRSVRWDTLSKVLGALNIKTTVSSPLMHAFEKAKELKNERS